MADSKFVDVKGMLLNGTTKEEMLKSLEDEIAAAQEEIAAEVAKEKAEKEKAVHVDELRDAVIHAAIDYLDALNIINKEDFSEEDFRTASKAVKDSENRFKDSMVFWDQIQNSFEKRSKEHMNLVSKMMDSDRELREFLKSL